MPSRLVIIVVKFVLLSLLLHWTRESSLIVIGVNGVDVVNRALSPGRCWRVQVRKICVVL